LDPYLRQAIWLGPREEDQADKHVPLTADPDQRDYETNYEGIHDKQDHLKQEQQC